MNTAAKIADPRVMTVEVTDDKICAFGGWTDDQRAFGLVMAVSERHRETAAALGNPWRLREGRWPDTDEDLSVEVMLYGTPAHRPRGPAGRVT
jgi:hypothetical protein